MQTGPDRNQGQLFQVVSQSGCVFAWGFGVAVGWQALPSVDLLGAVLRGAGVWLGITLIWIAGIYAWRQIVGMGRPRTASVRRPVSAASRLAERESGS